MNTKESLIAFNGILSLTNKSIFRVRKKLTKALLIPFFFVSLLAVAEYQLELAYVQDKVWYQLILLPFDFVLTGLIAIVVHRILLLGENSVSNWGIVAWTKREARFVSRYIGISLILGSMLFFLYAIKIGTINIGLITAILFGFILWSRWLLIFPGIAVDQPLSLAQSWALTENCKLLMALVAVVLPITFVLLSIALYIPIIMYVNDNLIQKVLLALIVNGYAVYLISALTMTYRFILDQHASEKLTSDDIDQPAQPNILSKLFIPLLALALIVLLVGINGRITQADKSNSQTVNSSLLLKDDFKSPDVTGNPETAKLNNDPQIVKSIESFKKNLTNAEQIGNEKLAAVFNQSLGILYASNGDRTKAFEHFNRALIIFEKVNSQLGIASTFSAVADQYGNWGQQNKAIEYYEKVLSIYENLKDENNKAVIYLRLSRQYEASRDTSKAIDYGQKALAIHQNLGDREAMANDFVKLGRLYSSGEVLNTSLEYYKKALALKEKLQDKAAMVNIYEDLGRIYEKQAKTEFAMQAYKKRDEINKSLYLNN